MDPKLVEKCVVHNCVSQPTHCKVSQGCVLYGFCLESNHLIYRKGLNRTKTLMCNVIQIVENLLFKMDETGYKLPFISLFISSLLSFIIYYYHS